MGEMHPPPRARPPRTRRRRWSRRPRHSCRRRRRRRRAGSDCSWSGTPCCWRSFARPGLCPVPRPCGWRRRQAGKRGTSSSWSRPTTWRIFSRRRRRSSPPALRRPRRLTSRGASPVHPVSAWAAASTSAWAASAPAWAAWSTASPARQEAAAASSALVGASARSATESGGAPARSACRPCSAAWATPASAGRQRLRRRLQPQVGLRLSPAPPSTTWHTCSGERVDPRIRHGGDQLGSSEGHPRGVHGGARQAPRPAALRFER